MCSEMEYSVSVPTRFLPSAPAWHLIPPFPALLLSGDQFAVSFTSLFSPLGNEYDLIGKYPQSEHTIKSASQYSSLMSELRTALSPELELIDARVIDPCKELTDVMKKIRKTMTKREHKVGWLLFLPSISRADDSLRSACRLRPTQQLVDQASREEGKVSERRKEPFQGEGFPGSVSIWTDFG